MMRRPTVPFLFAVVLMLPAAASSQELTSDRPDFTESVVVVSRPQLESGYTLTRTDGISRHAIGELLLRIGLTRRFELRVLANSYVLTRGNGVEANGIEDAGIGAKFSLSPRAAVIVGAIFPTGASTETADGVVPEVLLSLERPLSESVALGANASFASQPGPSGRSGEASGSIVLGAEIGRRTGVFAEAYGTRVLNGPFRDHAVFTDVGMTRSITGDLQLDARVGHRLNGAGEWYVGVGLVRRW
ncbi:MAG: transporter [Longimicrobiales bacterium]